jgi:uncharacterized protein YdaU (DUF1376 family)
MAAIPFMPLYVADYLADAAHLSTLEHGAYLLLIMTYWQRGEALPDDDKKLARITRLEPRTWAKIKPSLSDFFEVSDGKYIHSRVERELCNVRAKSLKKRAGGLARAKQMHSTCLAPVQLSDTDTNTDKPLSKDKGDSDKMFWDNAVSYIGNRGKVAKLLKGRKQTDVARAITEAQLARAVDPFPYVERILRNQAADAVEMPVA